MHRVGAAVLGLGLLTFGVLGFINQLEFFSTEGERVLGLSSNGLLSTVSVVVGGVLIGAGARGGRTASTVTAVIGVLFLLSGLGSLAVLNTSANLLAFRIPNVIFSLIAGMLLLFLGLYGRVSGGLAPDNPYLRVPKRVPDAPRTSTAADDRLLAAEIATAEGHATPEQAEAVQTDRQRRADNARRRAWAHVTKSGDHAALNQPDVLPTKTRRDAADGPRMTRRSGAEAHVAGDRHVAQSRAIGGQPWRGDRNSATTTEPDVCR